MGLGLENMSFVQIWTFPPLLAKIKLLNWLSTPLKKWLCEAPFNREFYEAPTGFMKHPQICRKKNKMCLYVYVYKAPSV